MWDDKVWIVLERIIGLIGLVVLIFGVWNTLLRNETKQAERHKQINTTLEAIRTRMDNEELWQQVSKRINTEQ